jgi:hypothetical protein
MVGLVVPLAVVNFSLSLSHPGERVLLFRDRIVIVGLQGAVLFKKVLVDLLEGFLFRENSTSLRL